MSGFCIREKKKVIGFNLLLYIIFAMMLFVAISSKQGYNIDEICTYGLANSYYEIPLGIQFSDGAVYEEPSSIWMEYMTVPAWNDFNYGQVLDNQAMDVHPPLYYALVHTLSSFEPYSFSIWYTAVINVVFAIMTLCVVQMLSMLLTESKTFFWGISVAFVFCAGVLSLATFLRMYVMTMFWVTLITYLFLWMQKKGFSWIGLLCIGAVSMMGALTHYYFLVYLFLICVVYGIYLLYKKMWKEVVAFLLTMTLAGGVCLTVFPAMWNHMFGGGYRGEASVNNFKSVDIVTYLTKLYDYFQLINKNIFGGWLIIFIIGLIGIGFWKLSKRKESLQCVKKDKNIDVEQLFGWLILLFPSVAYYMLISRIAVYTTDRYISPIYAVILVGIFLLIYVAGEKILDEKKNRIVLGTVAALVIVGGFYNCKWPYLERGAKEVLSTAQNYEDVDCIYVYETEWMILPAFQEVSYYDTVTFINVNKMEQLEQVALDKDLSELVVMVEREVDVQDVFNRVQECFERIEEYEKLGTYEYTTTYYMSGME